MKNDGVGDNGLDMIFIWAKQAERYICEYADGLLIFGSGGSGHWVTQTQQKAFAIYAVAGYFAEKQGGNADKYFDIALGLLRYSIRSHKAGDIVCPDDGNAWGNTWISALGIERMFHALELVSDRLGADDREYLQKMMLSESDFLLNEYAILANPVTPNKPESNLWNGAFLLRTAMMYPQAKNAQAYREKGIRFILNGNSVSADATSERIYEDKPLKDWHIGANYHDSFALGHHGYLNIGYMVISLSQIAYIHFYFKHLGKPAPEALYHNLRPIWELVRACMFEDGRLNRIGGDTRVRYCYCQDYILPVLALISDYFSEDTSALAEGWLNIISKEFDYNADGSFLSKRCELLAERSLIYFTRLETDRACTISQYLYWKSIYAMSKTKRRLSLPNQKKWQDDYHGAFLLRDDDRLVSFVWRAGEGPQAMCLPHNDSSLAEWRQNMTGAIDGGGLSNANKVVEFSGRHFENGFVTCGYYTAVTSGFLEEGEAGTRNIAENHIAFVAVPDGKSVVTIQRAVTLQRCLLPSVKPLKLNIPNDVFNDFKREYDISKNLLAVDGKLAVISIYGGEPRLDRAANRQIGVKSIHYPNSGVANSEAYDGRGFLACDEICIGGISSPKLFNKGEVLFDFAVAVIVGDNANGCGKILQESNGVETGNPTLKHIIFIGADNKTYHIVANFGQKEILYRIAALNKAVVLPPVSADIF